MHWIFHHSTRYTGLQWCIQFLLCFHPLYDRDVCTAPRSPHILQWKPDQKASIYGKRFLLPVFVILLSIFELTPAPICAHSYMCRLTDIDRRPKPVRLHTLKSLFCLRVQPATLVDSHNWLCASSSLSHLLIVWLEAVGSLPSSLPTCLLAVADLLSVRSFLAVFGLGLFLPPAMACSLHSI